MYYNQFGGGGGGGCELVHAQALIYWIQQCFILTILNKYSVWFMKNSF